MERNLARYLDADKDYFILDVGSQLVVGLGLQRTYRDLMKPNWKYIGIDIVPGENVDIVMSNESIPFPDNSVDVVLSGQCLEHCYNPFTLINEMIRVLNPGGIIIVAAPFNQGKHTNIDRWRFLPQGFESLFEHSKLECINIYLHKGEKFYDCWGIGRK